MFTRARLHLTLLYAALLGVTVVLVAGAIGALAVREARTTDDRELAVRASAMASAIPPGPPPQPSGPRPGFAGPPGPPPRLEGQGFLEYLLPVRDGQILTPPFGGLAGLPNLDAAEQAVRDGRAQYENISVSGNQVRMYTLPVQREGRTDAIVQVARSRYFVDAAVGKLALIALGAGILGLTLSAAAGYWLAGRTLRPIAEALDRQRNFASDASHELRTPLTVMLTNAELLTLHPERRLEEYEDIISDLVAEIQRLSRLVGDLLTLARADDGKIVLKRDDVNLAEVAKAVVRQFAAAAADKGLALECDVESEPQVVGDADRLRELAVILVDNAVRYTNAGSVTVQIARHGSDAVLAVADTGPGIAPTHHAKLFERFYRTDAARSADDGGSGLGLALAKWLVEAHKGRIELTSVPGHGSTFTVYLPAVRGSQALSGRDSRERATVGSGG